MPNIFIDTTEEYYLSLLDNLNYMFMTYNSFDMKQRLFEKNQDTLDNPTDIKESEEKSQIKKQMDDLYDYSFKVMAFLEKIESFILKHENNQDKFMANDSLLLMSRYSDYTKKLLEEVSLIISKIGNDKVFINVVKLIINIKCGLQNLDNEFNIALNNVKKNTNTYYEIFEGIFLYLFRNKKKERKRLSIEIGLEMESINGDSSLVEDIEEEQESSAKLLIN